MSRRSIRVASKAVILDGGEILLTRNLHPDDPDGVFYLLPGGGQLHGEALDDCLRREVCEETGYAIEVGDVLWVRDYIGASHEFAAYEPEVHQLEIMFSCSVDRSRPPADPIEVDAWQLSVDWVPVQDLPGLRFFPAALVPQLIGLARQGDTGSHYLGDVN